VTLKDPFQQPIKQPPRKLPYAHLSLVTQKVKDMMQQGIVEHGVSPWATPLTIVAKKDGDIRICQDYRKVNNITIKDAYPIPLMEDLFDRIGIKTPKYMASIDQKQGYNQIMLTQNAKEILAYCTPTQLLQHKRMPFGVTNGPAAFQRLMDEIFKGMPQEHIIWYLDDLLIVADTWELFLEMTEICLQKYAEAGIVMKPSKCKWCYNVTPFLGHEFTEKGKKPAQDRIQKVRDYPILKTVSYVRTFMGLVSYYRKFVKNLAALAKPIYELISN